jgi:predicted Rossmann-fold nucleotide-binding protein
MPDESGALRFNPSTEDILAPFEAFKRDQGIHHIVAFSGGADNPMAGTQDKTLRDKYAELLDTHITHEIEQAMRTLRPFRVAILTGGTQFGVPKIATRAAKQLGLTTVGIYPAAGETKALGSDLLDFSICVPSNFGPSCWGDESPLFAKTLDGVVVLGGGAGTMIEISHVAKINEKRLSKGQRVKFIVPISGTSGVAEDLPYFRMKPEVRGASMPEHRVFSGAMAAQFLIDKLELEDFRD